MPKNYLLMIFFKMKELVSLWMEKGRIISKTVPHLGTVIIPVVGRKTHHLRSWMGYKVVV